MKKTTYLRAWILATCQWTTAGAIALAIIFPAAIVTIRAQAQIFTTLYSFSGAADGAGPISGLIMDSQGNLYGTTSEGGNASCLNGCGTVFKVDTTGKKTVLYSFTGTGGDGSYPSANLLRDIQGNLYGTTQSGGNLTCNGGLGCGTAFKLDSAGTETILHSFTGTSNDGKFPLFGGLITDTAGNLYGTTSEGGKHGGGTIFKLDASENETVLYSFTGTGGDGSQPQAGLILDAQGNMYGTTFAGGSSNAGTVFKLDKSGNESVLHAFNVTSGLQPSSALILDSLGNLYGTTYSGGSGVAGGSGLLFKLSKTGTETVVHKFAASGKQGYHPRDTLVRDAQGNLYGTTLYGGAFGYGTVFKVDKTGKETVLHSFSWTDGANPIAGLLRDTQGNLYGTTWQGGTGNGFGTVFKVAP